MSFNILPGESITIERHDDVVEILLYKGETDSINTRITADKFDIGSFGMYVEKLRTEIEQNRTRKDADNAGSQQGLDADGQRASTNTPR